MTANEWEEEDDKSLHYTQQSFCDSEFDYYRRLISDYIDGYHDYSSGVEISWKDSVIVNHDGYANGFQEKYYSTLKRVDFGTHIEWASRNIEGYYSPSDIHRLARDGWRIPTRYEFEELLRNSRINFSSNFRCGFCNIEHTSGWGDKVVLTLEEAKHNGWWIVDDDVRAEHVGYYLVDNPGGTPQVLRICDNPGNGISFIPAKQSETYSVILVKDKQALRNETASLYFTDEELLVIERQGTDNYSEDGKTFLNYVGKNHSINSYRVKDGTLRIDDFAFSWNPYDDEDEESDILTLETIQLPDGLQEIGEGAFDGCLNLKQLIIPDSVNQIGQGALRNLNSIEYIHLPSSLVTMKEDLIQSTSLRFLSIPQGVRFIRQGSISCENLETLEMPASIEEVDEYSICCNNLKVIKFNAGKERMEELWENEGTHSYGGYKYDVNHFVGIPQKAVLYVPSAAYEVYRRFFPDNSIITY